MRIVDLNGSIARLDSVEIAEDNPSLSDKKRKASEVQDLSSIQDTTDKSEPSHCSGDGAAEAVVPKIDWDDCEKELAKLLDEIHGRELISFLQHHETLNSDDTESKDVNSPKFYTLPVISDKQIRRSVHQLIKSPAFSSIARADNADGKIRVWHRKFASDMPVDTHGGDGNRNNGKGGGQRGGGGGGRTPWPKDRPDFLRFVLYKENVDTTTAAKDIARLARVNPHKSINFAGMKDKRGITTQFCSIYRVEKETLLAVNNGNKSNSTPEVLGGCGNTTSNGSNIIKLGNFEYSSEEVKLGGLSGNRFDVALRNVDIGDKSAADSTTMRQQVQLICESAGTALKTNGFVNYFGMQRFGKYHDTHLVGIAIIRGDFEGAIDIIMREKPDEYPRIAEARRRWANRFEFIDATKDENAAREAEKKVARDIQKDLGRFLNCEKSIVSSLVQKPRDYKRAFGSISKNMRSMFLHAYQSYIFNLAASERIEASGSTQVCVGDLVLIEDKSLRVEGGGTSGLKGKAVKMLDEQDLLNSPHTINDVVLPLVGTKIVYPGGKSGYLFDELLKRDGISKEAIARIGSFDREISLCGDYRKLICKPADVTFEVKVYENPLQPLLQTDLMKVNGIDVTSPSLPVSNGQDEQNHNVIVSQNDQDGEGDKIIFGMTIGFSLPPSSYATIALRELTKRPTSSEYQSKLEVSGKCERNASSGNC